MTLARYEAKLTDITNQMNKIERFTPEWNELEKQRMKTWIKISDIRRKEARAAKLEKVRLQNSIIAEMNKHERYSPKWTELSRQLLAII